MPNSLKRKLYKNVNYLFMIISTLLVSAVVGFIIIYVLVKGIPNISWSFISTSPSYRKSTIGILPDILNTVYLIIMTLLLCLPIGIGAAIYLNEYAKNQKVVDVILFAIKTLSGIPSIIYGLVGMLIFCEVLGMQTSIMAGSLTLAIMNLPTIITTTLESLKTVPQSYREGAYGLGAGKWHCIRTVVLPNCLDGIITGAILSIGRIIGESAALLFTAGFAHKVHGFFSGLNSPGASLTVALYVYAKEQGDFNTAFGIAAILIFLTFIINILVKLIKLRYERSK